MAALIHIMKACSLVMQLVDAFPPMGNRVAHPPSFTHHAPGVISHNAIDMPTMAFKAVGMDSDVMDTTASAHERQVPKLAG